jgi:hypothetical protein
MNGLLRPALSHLASPSLGHPGYRPSLRSFQQMITGGGKAIIR